MWCELLLEVGGFGLEVGLTIVVPNCADFGLTRVLWSFMLRFLDLVTLQRLVLLAPAIISALGYPDLTGRINNALTLCNQHINLLQLCGHIYRLVPLSRHLRKPKVGRTT